MNRQAGNEIDERIREAVAMNLGNASPDEIAALLSNTLRDSTSFDRAYGIEQDSPVKARVRKFLSDCSAQLKAELCEDGKLKASWDKALRDDSLSDILKALSTALLGMINPAFAAPSVAVLAALWLLRMGLNSWCSRTVDQLLANA